MCGISSARDVSFTYDGNGNIASTKTGLLYEQTLADCAPNRDEFSIRKMVRGPRTITDVSYSKTTAMNDAERRKWEQIIGRSKG
jgi:hypothetical protein